MLWTVTASAEDACGTGTQTIPPDGCMEIILHLADDVEETRVDGTVRVQPRAMLVGETQRPSCVSPRGALDIVGVRLTPAGVRAFFDAPAHELVDSTHPLEAVLDTATTRELEVIASADPVDRLALIERALLAKIRRGRKHDALVARIVARMEAEGGIVQVEALAGSAGLTRRQLERRFLDAVGISPKALAQVLRFQRVLTALGAGSPRWVHVAAACGYYDQAHLIRDFKRFTRATPRAFLGREHPFADLFVPSHDVASVQSSAGVSA
jgi:AraC-like DNA-binding protein